MKNQKGIYTIFVNPVPRISPQGRNRQIYTVLDPETGEMKPGRSMNKTRETGTTYEIGFLRDRKNPQKLKTGLDEELDNELYFKGEDPERIITKYNLDRKQWGVILQDIVEAETITKQTCYEILAGVDPGDYTPVCKANSIFGMTNSTDTKQKPGYLETFKIILYDKPNRFSSDTPRGRLAIECVKNNPKVANSYSEMNTTRHDFYISEENEQEIKVRKRNKIVEDAIYDMINIRRNYSPYRVYQFASLLLDSAGKPIVKGKVSQAVVEDQLSAYIRNKTNSQMDNINKFNELKDCFENSDCANRFEVKYMVRQAINTNVMSIRDGFVLWNTKKGIEEHYKFNSLDAVERFLTKEYEVWNPKDPDISNAFGDLYEELKLKDVWLEDVN